ncbi:MAG TPA: hypothetical protein VLE91_03650 [Candidatus Saccharimonadales bacterium]|nr:hypothetical protein [Candidatus Saccharimonadales bacterium]
MDERQDGGLLNYSDVRRAWARIEAGAKFTFDDSSKNILEFKPLPEQPSLLRIKVLLYYAEHNGYLGGELIVPADDILSALSNLAQDNGSGSTITIFPGGARFTLSRDEYGGESFTFKTDKFPGDTHYIDQPLLG